MAMGMATRLMAMGMATRLMVMATATGPVTTIRLTGLTELLIALLSDAISMPPLPVSIVIVIGTNAGRVRAIRQPGRSIYWWLSSAPAGSALTGLLNGRYRW